MHYAIILVGIHHAVMCSVHMCHKHTCRYVANTPGPVYLSHNPPRNYWQNYSLLKVSCRHAPEYVYTFYVNTCMYKYTVVHTFSFIRSLVSKASLTKRWTCSAPASSCLLCSAREFNSSHLHTQIHVHTHTHRKHKPLFTTIILYACLCMVGLLYDDLSIYAKVP